MSKKSTKDSDWREFGRLLHLARNTLSTATCAGHQVLPLSPFVNKADRILKQLDQLRSDCEDEMFKRTDLTDLKIFYPGGPLIAGRRRGPCWWCTEETHRFITAPSYYEDGKVQLYACRACESKALAYQAQVLANLKFITDAGWKESRAATVWPVVFGSPQAIPHRYDWTHSPEGWMDHSRVYYRSADKEYLYVAEPYNIETRVAPVIEFCAKHNVNYWIHEDPVHNPRSCGAIWIVRPGVSFTALECPRTGNLSEIPMIAQEA